MASAGLEDFLDFAYGVHHNYNEKITRKRRLRAGLRGKNLCENRTRLWGSVQGLRSKRRNAQLITRRVRRLIASARGSLRLIGSLSAGKHEA